MGRALGSGEGVASSTWRPLAAPPPPIRLVPHQHGLRVTAPSQTSPPSSAVGTSPEHPQVQDSVGKTRSCSPGLRDLGFISFHGGFRGPGVHPHLPGGPGPPGARQAQGAAPGVQSPGPDGTQQAVQRGEHVAQEHSAQGAGRRALEDPGGAAGAGWGKGEGGEAGEDLAERRTQRAASRPCAQAHTAVSPCRLPKKSQTASSLPPS